MSLLFSLLCDLAALLWYRLIWTFSAQTAAVSGDLSDRLLWRILHRLSPAFAGADPFVQDGAVELLSFFERKAAHMFLYFVLALLLVPVFRHLKDHRRFGASAAGCLVLAALDEYHQSLVPGRAGQVRDVAIDMAGALLALGLLALILWLRKRRQAGGLTVTGKALLPVILAAAAMAVLPRIFGSAAGIPAVRGLAERFIDVFPSLPAGEQEALVAAMHPIAAEALLLFLAGLLGAAAVLSAALCGLEAFWLFPAVLPGTAFLCALFCRTVWSCVGTGLLGWALAALIWLLAHRWQLGRKTP